MPTDTAPKRPPRKRPPSSNGDNREPRPPTGTPQLERRLDDFFSMLALPFAAAGDQHCAGIIARGAPGMAEAWSALARDNAGVRRVLEQLLSGGAWGGVIVSTLAVALPVAAHHTSLPLSIPGLAGPPPPPDEPTGEPRTPGGEPPAPSVPPVRSRRPAPSPAPEPGPAVPGGGAPGPAAMSLPPMP